MGKCALSQSRLWRFVMRSAAKASRFPAGRSEIVSQGTPREALSEDHLYEMANVYPDDSVLPMTVWVRPRSDERHGPRIKVCTAHGLAHDTVAWRCSRSGSSLRADCQRPICAPSASGSGSTRRRSSRIGKAESPQSNSAGDCRNSCVGGGHDGPDLRFLAPSCEHVSQYG